jgi:hypothetical protein
MDSVRRPVLCLLVPAPAQETLPPRRAPVSSMFLARPIEPCVCDMVWSSPRCPVPDVAFSCHFTAGRCPGSHCRRLETHCGCLAAQYEGVYVTPTGRADSYHGARGRYSG